MCLIIFGYKTHQTFPLVVAANRDELYDRPSASSHFWPDNPNILAGRDLLANGAWMGISKLGRFAAVTNGIMASSHSKKVESRGKLTVDFLDGTTSAKEYALEIAARSANFNNFHLLICDIKSMWYVASSASGNDINTLELLPGVYGLSNAGLNSRWPKCETGEKEMSALLAKDVFELPDLLSVISERTPAPKSKLVSLGLHEKQQSFLSAQFVSTETYGTRCSTLLRLNLDNALEWLEVSFDESAKVSGSVAKEFKLETNSSKTMMDE